MAQLARNYRMHSERVISLVDESKPALEGEWRKKMRNMWEWSRKYDTCIEGM